MAKLLQTIALSILVSISVVICMVRSQPVSASLPSPVIVADGMKVFDHTGAQTFTIFTPKTDGLFRISTYATFTGVSEKYAGAIIYMGWTDEQLTQETSVAESNGSNAGIFHYSNSNNLGGATGSSITLSCKGGTPVVYRIAGNKVEGTRFNIHYAVEQLR